MYQIKEDEEGTQSNWEENKKKGKKISSWKRNISFLSEKTKPIQSTGLFKKLVMNGCLLTDILDGKMKETCFPKYQLC